MLVSATMPQRVLDLVGTGCIRNHDFLDSVGRRVATQSRVCAPLLEIVGFQRHRGEDGPGLPKPHDHGVFPHRSFHTVYGAPFRRRLKIRLALHVWLVQARHGLQKVFIRLHSGWSRRRPCALESSLTWPNEWYSTLFDSIVSCQCLAVLFELLCV